MTAEGGAPRRRSRLGALAGRIWVRLLLVNITAVLVPIAGLEFARIYERQLLDALERDMNNQLALTRALLEEDATAGIPLEDARHTRILERAARETRTRLRLLDPDGNVVADSHGHGPPEGREPTPPRLFGSDSTRYRAPSSRAPGWPPVGERSEVKRALGGHAGTYTRVARDPKAVYLFSATPVRARSKPQGARVVGAVYATRSTAPVLFELHRVRTGLFKVLALSLGLGAAITVALALSISRPLARLSRAAKRIAAGERQVVVPVEGGGEIRELSESFEKMTAELDARLTYISDFSADVAHEFKSPLTAIRGAAELLAEGAHEDPETRERFLKNILVDAERLDRLVSRLLVLGRIEAARGDPALLDLRDVVRSAATRAQQTHPVEVDVGPAPVMVHGREADLEMAVSNLVENAQRYSPSGVPVSVTLTEVGTCATVTVADRGPGIVEAKRGRIFERFYTTDADGGGTGLGLAIVDSVVRAHGGTVEFRPGEPTGACFDIRLPRARLAGAPTRVT